MYESAAEVDISSSEYEKKKKKMAFTVKKKFTQTLQVNKVKIDITMKLPQSIYLKPIMFSKISCLTMRMICFL